MVISVIVINKTSPSPFFLFFKSILAIAVVWLQNKANVSAVSQEAWQVLPPVGASEDYKSMFSVLF